MPGKHFDLDINKNLGGANASDLYIASQKAVKDYVDTKISEIALDDIAIVDLKDVNVTDVVANNTLIYDATTKKWINKTINEWGQITGTITNQKDLKQELDKKANNADLAAVAKSGSYNDLTNKPTIPDVTAYSEHIANTDIHVTADDKTNWNGKQDKINDLETIRSGASKGATSIQPNDNISKLTNDAGYLTEDDLTSAMMYQGSVQSYDNLPTSGNKKGDFWNVLDDDANYAWNGTGWDFVGKPVDLTGYQVKITDTNKLNADLLSEGTTNKLVSATEKTTWTNKQDKINDLSTIRSNAEAGKNASDTIADYGDIVGHNASEFALASHEHTITDVTGLQTALDGKQANITSTNKLSADLLSEGTTNKLVSSTEKSTWNAKQDAISDLSTIRSNANAGKNAADTIATYGDIVSHNASEFQEAGDYAAESHTHTKSEITDFPTIPTVNNAVITIQKNGTKVDSFTANQATAKTINITVPTNAADVSALPATTKYAKDLSVTIDPDTFVITAILKDQDGTALQTQTIDLSLESVVVSGSYDKTNKKIVLTLQSGSTLDIPVADLIAGLQTEITETNKLSADLIEDGVTNKVVTEAEKTTWSGKQDKISDLTTIRFNAQAGKDASTTISGYGDVVTHDASDFAPASHNHAISEITNLQSTLDDKQSKITSTSKLDADLIADGTTNKMVTAAEKTAWNNKQNAINDLDTIRSGATAGSTAVQPEDLASVATTGSYTDLIDKPNIPAEVTETTVSGWGFTKNTGTLTGVKMNGASKPVTDGVVDLGTVITSHQDISNKVDKDDLATVATTGSYEDLINKPTIPSEVTETTVSGWGFTKNTGTVTGVKINGTTKNPTNGIVDVGTVITEHQDISGKQDKITSTNKLSADLLKDGTTNKTVTATEKETWNNKQNAITDLTTIRTNAANGNNAATTIAGYGDIVTHDASEFQPAGDYAAEVHTHTKADITDFPAIPSKTSDLTNDSGFITSIPVASSTVSGTVKIGSNLSIKDGVLNADDQRTTVDSALSSTSTNPVQNKVINSALAGKQDTIDDLATIRDGASKGATALQSVPAEYITETELEAKGYLTQHQDISGKQDKITSTNKLSADLVVDGTTNKVVTASEKATWNGKQDTISDLAAIRSGASTGATAVQPDDLATVATSGSYTDLTNKPTIPTVNNATITIQKNGTKVDSFTANQATAKTINITVPTTAADVSALPASTKYGYSFDLSIDSDTYVISLTMKDQNGTAIGTAQTIDLPLESVVVSGSYDNTNKKIVLTLQSGSTVDVPVGDLIAGLQTEITSTNKLSADLIADGTTNKVVTATEKNTWNGKQNAISDLATIRSGAAAGATAVQPGDLATVATSGSYNDLSNKPTIPTITDTYSATSGNGMSGKAVASAISGLTRTTVTFRAW